LHPKLRLATILILLDRSAKLADVLADLPEITAWCSPDCQVFGRVSGHPELVLWVPVPADGQRQAATLAAGLVLPASDGQHDWSPAVELELDSQARPSSQNAWLSASIKQVRISAIDMTFERRLDPKVWGKWEELGALRDAAP
jgi:hypothetical protein